MLLNIFKTVFLSSSSSYGHKITPYSFSQNPVLSAQSSSGGRPEWYLEILKFGGITLSARSNQEWSYFYSKSDWHGRVSRVAFDAISSQYCYQVIAAIIKTVHRTQWALADFISNRTHLRFQIYNVPHFYSFLKHVPCQRIISVLSFFPTVLPSILEVTG